MYTHKEVRESRKGQTAHRDRQEDSHREGGRRRITGRKALKSITGASSFPVTSAYKSEDAFHF